MVGNTRHAAASFSAEAGSGCSCPPVAARAVRVRYRRRVRAALALIALAGCQRKPAAVDDCKLVFDDPAHAVVELGKRYPDDAVMRAEVIERCIAPEASGDECDRLARIAAVIPSMMSPAAAGSATARSEADYRTACRGMPPEMRRCMRTSYVLGHPEECQAMLGRMKAAAAELAVAPKQSEPCNGGRVAVYVVPEGLWLATGAEARCFALRRDGELAAAWLEGELKQFSGRTCPPSVELAGAAGVRYQDAIAAMDVAIKVGLLEVGLTSPAELPGGLAAADVRRALAHCPATTLAREAAPLAPLAEAAGSTNSAPRPLVPLTEQTPLPPARPKVDASTPVVIITRDELSFRGGVVGRVAEIRRGAGPIAALASALAPSPSDPRIVLQADESTDMVVITRVIDTAQKAGYHDVLFAVKNK